jgi:hypothetical protein
VRPNTGASIEESMSPCTKGLARTAADDPARELNRILSSKGGFEALAPLVKLAPAKQDDFLRALFPGIADKPIVDRPPDVPEPYVGKINHDFEVHPIGFPVDWDANPFEDVSWQLWFQSLNWLPQVDQATAAYIVVDWTNHALYRDPALQFTWGDHAMGMRLTRVTGFVQEYTRNAEELDRSVLQAAATLILVHVYGLASSPCYTKKHNHGLMQDLALLENIHHYPELREGERLRKLAMARAIEQISVSVKPDGIQIENSPHYQAHYANMALRVVAASQAGGHTSDPELLASASRIFAALIRMVQPNLTLAQFGDTTNIDRSEELSTLLTRGRAMGLDAQILDELDWLLSRGAHGQMPEETDTVYPEGGFVAYRNAWTKTDQAITAHFSTSHFSRAHYHPDETGVEIYGYGTELIVGPGIHGYDQSDPFVAYQASPAAHNVLVVDEVPAVDRKPHALSKIVAHGSGDGVVWVQGTHPNYRKLGVEVVRTFAYRKPTQFVIVDHVSAAEEHRYAQHFHLHPSLTSVKTVGNTVVARSSAKGPSITLTAIGDTKIDLFRGVKEEGHIAGWHFPDKYKEDAATEVVMHRLQKGAGTTLALPVLIVVSPPGSEPAIPKNVKFAVEEGKLSLQWQEGKAEHAVSVPMPPVEGN